MPTTTIPPTVSAEQYRALQVPLTLPTPEELFEFQVAALRAKELDLLDEDIDRLRPHIPIEPQLFVVMPRRPQQLDLLLGLMALVEVEGKRGKNHLDSKYLTDAVETPTAAHLLLDVEDGRQRLNTKPNVSRENILRACRVPYTAWYGLVHCIMFPWVLQDHYLGLCGSHYTAGVPGLCLYSMGPLLKGYWNDCADPVWRAPSAGKIVGA